MRFYQSNNTDVKVNGIVTEVIQSIGSELPTIEPINMDDVNKNYDLLEFLDDLYDFFSKYNEKTLEFKDFSFKPEFAYNIPGEDESNSIRFSIIERTNATTEQNGHNPNQGRKNFKWTLYTVVDDIQNPGYKVLVYTKPMDNKVEIVSWSKNYRDANQAAFKLENLIDTYAKLFKMKGLLELRFDGRKTDIFREKANYAWYGCPLEYYVKTVQVKLVYEKTLEELIIEVTTKK